MAVIDKFSFKEGIEYHKALYPVLFLVAPLQAVLTSSVSLPSLGVCRESAVTAARA